MNGYTFHLENGAENLPEIEPLYRQHYAEMKARLDAEGVPVGEYRPRYQQYLDAWNEGWLLNFIVRKNGKPVGYGNCYITQDAHNSELIAQEDTIYVLPEHRNGVGRKLLKFALEELRRRGVKRLHVTAGTDPRVPKLWQRMGFRPVAQAMIYNFEEHR